MLLAHHWHAGGVREFDVSTGSVGETRDVPRSAAEWGFLWNQRGRWFAIRKDDQSLIFQAGSRTWRLREDVELRVTRGIRRRFEIIRGEGREFDLRYVFRGAVAAIIDPTYDAIDEETDDFFLYVTEMWRHWKGRSMSAFLKE